MKCFLGVGKWLHAIFCVLCVFPLWLNKDLTAVNRNFGMLNRALGGVKIFVVGYESRNNRKTFLDFRIFCIFAVCSYMAMGLYVYLSVL